MINNRVIALITRLITIGIALAGILIGVIGGASALMFYTIQSNILVLILFVMLFVKTLLDLIKTGVHGSNSHFERFEMVAMVDIILTFLVYWILLAPKMFTMDENYSQWSFYNLSVHAIVPILCILDYVFYTKSKHLKYIDVYLVLVWPLAYVIYSSIAGFSGYVYYYDNGVPVRFPYFFINYDEVGWFSLLYIAGLCAFFLVLSHLIYLFDRKVNKRIIIPRNDVNGASKLD